MIEVDNLEERLDSRSFLYLLLRHRLGNLQRLPRNARYYRMAVLPSLDAIIESRQTNALLSRISAIQNNDNLAGLQAAKQEVNYLSHTSRVFT